MIDVLQAVIHAQSKPSLSFNEQRGIVLPVALFVLVAATLLTVALVKNGMVTLRVGGASVIAQEAQASAELLLSNFFTRNPLTAQNNKYIQAYTPCSVSGDDPATNTNIFDCRQIGATNLPAHTTANAPVVQRIGCGAGPRSNAPTQAGTRFNYNVVETSVENEFYGSRAAVGMGVAKLVLACP